MTFHKRQCERGTALYTAEKADSKAKRMRQAQLSVRKHFCSVTPTIISEMEWLDCWCAAGVSMNTFFVFERGAVLCSPFIHKPPR